MIKFQVQHYTLKSYKHFDSIKESWVDFNNNPSLCPENLIANKINGFSLGYGLDLGASRIDISYVSQTSYFTNNLYPKGLTTLYSTDKSINKIIASYHFNF